jgi:Transposase C of IS166 homeodomain
MDVEFGRLDQAHHGCGALAGAEGSGEEPVVSTERHRIDQLTHEMAILKRWHFDRRSEQMDPMQRSLLDESIDADIEAISLELEALQEKPASPRVRARTPWTSMLPHLQYNQQYVSVFFL